MNRLKITVSIVLIFLISQVPSFAKGLAEQYVISGKTMGTFYNIKIISTSSLSTDLWKKKIDIRLKELNSRLSTYAPKSEISRFNRTPKNTPFKISNDFHKVLTKAATLYQLTHGAWDGTVKPLVDFWGFGTKKSLKTLPGQEQINAIMQDIGFDKLTISDHTLSKKGSRIRLDLGSIAKGYGVDAVASLLKRSGFNHFLVEIGGELFASGKNQKGNQWTVGISKPKKKYAQQILHKVIRLNNMAVATSGNYRNYIKIDQKFYSHIINPATGYPVDNRVVSTSVISKDCTFADGLATALMVMNVKDSLLLVNRLEDVECLIIVQDENKEFQNMYSKHFGSFLLNP